MNINHKEIIKTKVTDMQMTRAVRSNAPNVFHSNNVIVGSNPIQGMHFRVFFCLCCPVRR
jgi:hypothetical protein